MFLTKREQQKFCSQKCFSASRKKREIVICSWCKEPFVAKKCRGAQFCCLSHATLFRSSKTEGFEYLGKEIEEVMWNRSIAYLVGIITADGCLERNSSHIRIVSKDYDFILKLRDTICYEITKTKLKIVIRNVEYKGKNRKYYAYSFSSKYFYSFCQSIGLMPGKTLVLGSLNIPYLYFSDFLRGIIDGDGNFNIIKPRWSYRYVQYVHIRIYSGSLEFLEWVNDMCCKTLNIQGILFREKSKKNVWILFWSKEEFCNSIIEYIYSYCDIYLERKWASLQEARPFLNDTHVFLKNVFLPIPTYCKVHGITQELTSIVL
jgi:hypothetical protein